MKKYVLYNWHSDDGKCGIGICYAKDFISDTKFYYSNYQTHFLIEFDTVDEAVKFLSAHYNLSADERDEIREDVMYHLFWFHHDRGEYEEARKFQC